MPISAPRCFGIGRDFQQRLRAGGEQQIVEDSRVVQRQHIEFMGHGEDHMEVAGSEKLSLSCREPVFTRLRLALRAVPVPARVIGDGLVTALWTGIDMAAQRSRAAALDGAKGLELLKVETPSYRSRKRSPCARRMSATSTAGRLIFAADGGRTGWSPPTLETGKCSSGLIVCSRCRRDKCR